jgi:UDP-glucose 4-epimerase
MRVMVTGGAGFIGSHIVDLCVEHGHEVAVLDNFSSGRRENVNPKAAVYQCDVRDLAAVECAIGHFMPDAVSHQAALVDVPWCEEHPDETFEVNVAGTQNVFRASDGYRVSRFVLASSVGGYGECPAAANEGTPLVPLGVYGESKREAEVELEDAQSMGVTILRYSNVYGPRSTSGVVLAFLNALREGRRPIIYGDGEQVRDFVHVSDVARANLHAIELPQVGVWQVLNIASGNPTSVNRLWTMLSADFRPAREADIIESRIDPTGAREALDFRAKISLQEGLWALRSA